MLCGHEGDRKEVYCDILFPFLETNVIDVTTLAGNLKKRHFNVLMLTYLVLYIIVTGGINSLLQEELLVNVIYK